LKLATYQCGITPPKIGVVHSDDTLVFDLALAASREGSDLTILASMIDLIDSGVRGLDTARSLFERQGSDAELSTALDQVRLLAPVPEPRQIRDTMSFPTHIRQSSRGMRRLLLADDPVMVAALDREPLPPLPEIYRQSPIYYLSNRMVVGAPNETITWPSYSQVMDYELEFGVFVGRRGTNIPLRDAHDHIFGYTIFNDFSARDQQLKEMPGMFGPTKGKSFNGSNVLGPWIVTPDEIGDCYSLAMTARVNGETRSKGSSAGMLFSFEEMLVYMSQDETLHPGEFIGSGTVGNGCGLEQGRFLSHGDVIELEVDRIGVLRNRVISPT
jgi:2-keto-4-pentenoate hydratase/2-oxohepta-3-ene-1,7-dioic acid hydratase in catechol pathway